jgi:hypothetical protein
MTPAELVEHLKGVPPARLALIELAWALVGPEGAVDVDQARFHMEELLLAKAEATAYAQATNLLREALQQCLNPDL